MNEDKIIGSALTTVSNRFSVHTTKNMTRLVFLSGGGDNAQLVAAIAIDAENMPDFAALIASDAVKRQELITPPPSEQTLASGTSNDNLQTEA